MRVVVDPCCCLLAALALALIIGVGAHAAAPTLRVQTASVAGTVTDVASGPARLLVSHTAAGVRRLSFIAADTNAVTAGPVVAATAIAVDLCGDEVVFIDERGLVDGAGKVLIAQAPLLPVADPSLLPTMSICPNASERVLPVREGLAVVHLNGAGAVVDTRILRLAHRARAYTGTAGRSLRGERAYAAAISVYAPRLLSTDVDGDGDDDLVVLHERSLTLHRRGADGLLSTSGEVRDVAALIGARSSAELRLQRGPTPSTLLVASSEGALPEYSDVVVLGGPKASPLSVVQSRHRVDGLALVVGSTTGGAITIGRITTSLMALSGVVLTGRVTIDLFRDDAVVVSLPTVADVRAGRIDGALPVIDVDLDGDGRLDVVDLGEPGRAQWWRGSVDGYERIGEPAAIGRLERAIGDPARRTVILVGRAGKKTTNVARLSVR